MSWFYAVGDDRRGPVDDSEFQQLVADGVIEAHTLVWQNGMSEWAAYRDIQKEIVTAEGRLVCEECGNFFGRGDLITLDGRSICGTCKPRVIQRMQEGTGTTDEEIRNEHIKHEASIQSIGLLYLLGGSFLGLGALGLIIAGGEGLIGGLVAFLIALLHIWTAVHLRKLKRAARIPTGIFASLGLIAFPLGTIINAYILYLVFSQKGTYIMSEEYARVRERTPHIKHRTSIIVIVLVVLLLALMTLGLFAVLFAPARPLR